MLMIHLPKTEVFDEGLNEFTSYDALDLRLEYSLAALSKWESIWEVPFLRDEEHTDEETRSFVKCMIVDPDVPPEVVGRLTQTEFDLVAEYVNAKRTATWFNELMPEPKNDEQVTSELIYAWMTMHRIDWQAQYWHLSRLFTLIKVLNLKNSEPRKMSAAEARSRTARINAERRKAFAEAQKGGTTE